MKYSDVNISQKVVEEIVDKEINSFFDIPSQIKES